jgi:hypothetical protein
MKTFLHYLKWLRERLKRISKKYSSSENLDVATVKLRQGTAE